jgi:hypothetical protein
MNGLLGMGLLGWLAGLMVGFAVGGVFFMSIKAQVQYVLKRRGALWLAPALLYARILFIGVVLIVLAQTVPRDKLAAVVVAGAIGMMVARILVTRMVRRGGKDEPSAP